MESKDNSNNKQNKDFEKKVYERILKVMGIEAVDRLKRFQSIKNKTIDNQRPLNNLSTKQLDYFLSLYDQFITTPSLFMTSNGYLQIMFNSAQGETIEMDFYGEMVIIYTEETGREEAYQTKTEDDINKIIKRIDSLQE